MIVKAIASMFLVLCFLIIFALINSRMFFKTNQILKKVEMYLYYLAVVFGGLGFLLIS